MFTRVHSCISRPFNRSDNRYGNRGEPAPGTSLFNFKQATDGGGDFELVDNKPVPKKFGGPQQRRPQQPRWGQQPAHHGQGQPGRGGHGQQGGRGYGQQGGRGQGFGFRQPWRDQRAERVLSESIEVGSNWELLGDQISLPPLSKLTTKVDEGETLVSLGSLPGYDRAADRVAPKIPAKLKAPSAAAIFGASLRVWDDATMNKLAAGDEGDVFVSDLVLTVMMTAPRSVYPWDIVVKKVGGKLFIDRRSGSTLENVSNGETAPDPLQEDKENVNGIENVNAEATFVHQAFREQVLSSTKSHAIGDALPANLASASVPAAGFKYKRFDLGTIRVVVRCEVDGHVTVANNIQAVAVHALNEFDPKWSGIDWRTKIDTQRGAVLATELKNNAAKMARWTAQALLADVDVIKLGYVSRASFRSSKTHQLLGTQTVKPKDFASQMNLSMDNAWGIAKALLIFMRDAADEEGTLLLHSLRLLLSLHLIFLDVAAACTTSFEPPLPGLEGKRTRRWTRRAGRLARATRARACAGRPVHLPIRHSSRFSRCEVRVAHCFARDDCIQVNTCCCVITRLRSCASTRPAGWMEAVRMTTRPATSMRTATSRKKQTIVGVRGTERLIRGQPTRRFLPTHHLDRPRIHSRVGDLRGTSSPNRSTIIEYSSGYPFL